MSTKWSFFSRVSLSSPPYVPSARPISFLLI